MQEFTEKDCMQTEKEASIQNRVVVLPSKVLPEHYTGQLFFCTNIQKTENPRHSIAHLVSLSTEEAWHCWNRDVVGVLRPELLGEKERLQLSQIRPFGALDLHGHSPEYSGYSFLPDGRYASGVWLVNPEFQRLRHIFIYRIKFQSEHSAPGHRLLQQIPAAACPQNYFFALPSRTLEQCKERQIRHPDGRITFTAQCSVKIDGNDLDLFLHVLPSPSALMVSVSHMMCPILWTHVM